MWDVAQFCKDNRIQPKLKRTWLQIETCPFCGKDDFKSAFSVTGSSFNCWKCGKYKPHKAVAALLMISDTEAKEIIWGYSGRSSEVREYHKERKHASNIVLPGTKDFLKVHRKYIEKRNFDFDKLIREWDLYATGPAPNSPFQRWKFRLVFPIYLNGELVSFQARDVTGKSEIRYMGATIEQSKLHYKRLLYGQEKCIPERVGAVEGIFDLYRMGRGFVCTFGTSLTHDQLALLAVHEKVYFFFDPDDEQAVKKVKNYCSIIQIMGSKAYAVSWKGTDPGDLAPDDALYLRKETGFK